jgi:hypothetical protein
VRILLDMVVQVLNMPREFGTAISYVLLLFYVCYKFISSIRHFN